MDREQVCLAPGPEYHGQGPVYIDRGPGRVEPGPECIDRGQVCGIDQRDEALIARLREIYTSQGIEVTDKVLKEGVEALKEERFRYKPAEGGLQVWLAKLYITRGKWGKATLAVVAIVAVLIIVVFHARDRFEPEILYPFFLSLEHHGVGHQLVNPGHGDVRRGAAEVAALGPLDQHQRGAVELVAHPEVLHLLRIGEAQAEVRERLAALVDELGDAVVPLDALWSRDVRARIDEPFGRHAIETVRGVGYRLAEDGG